MHYILVFTFRFQFSKLAGGMYQQIQSVTGFLDIVVDSSRIVNCYFSPH